VTFDETAPCPHGVFECAGDKEMEESIFIDEGLQGINGDEDKPLLPSTSSPEPIPASTHHHPSLFLLPHLKQRLLMLPPPLQQ
jgi:hypothetical protein